MNKNLEEIIETSKKALRRIENEIANIPVTHLDEKKGSFVSVAGSFDSILILAEEVKKDIEKLEEYKFMYEGLEK